MPKDELRQSDAIGVKVSGVKVDIPDSPKMGLHSGYSEPKGRAPLTRPPKTRDLGIVEDDPRGWVLKAKTIPTLRWAMVFNALSSQGSLIDNEEISMGRIGRTSTTCSSLSLDGAAPLLWKNKEWRYGTDVYGRDPAYQHQQSRLRHHRRQ